MRLGNTLTSVNKEWFESLTKKEQTEYVSKLQEFRHLKPELQKQKVKEVLDGINFTAKKEIRKSKPSKSKENNSGDNSK